jgi:transcriptional regulator with XRE-family HTH domain
MTAEIQTIERRRKAMGLSRERLCASASVGRETYRAALNGRPAKAATLARLNDALRRFRIGFAGEASAIAPKAAFAGCLVFATFALDQVNPFQSARAALTSDPSRRATSDPAWLRAARIRQLGYWIANGCMGFRTSDIARAAGVTKQAVSSGISDVEDDPELAAVCRQIEEVFQP